MDDETLVDNPNPDGEPNARPGGGRPLASGSTRASASSPPGFPAPPKANDLSGTTLGDYRLVRKIAEGGMGEVYEAIQLKLDRRVALKILTDRLAAQPEFLRRFEREAKSAAALNHRGVVQVHDFGNANGRYYLIMEYVEGRNLGEYIEQRGKLPLPEALTMIEQTAAALKAACEKNIIHRDIKPDNLLLTADGHIKVSDLGLAKIMTEDLDLTATGAAFGSPHFLAPEQAEDAARVNHRADIYSLGITLLYLLTGRHSYEGTSAFALVLAHSNKPLPTGKDLGTELPPAVESLIQRMAAKRPEDRYQDYDSLLADLARVKAGSAPALKPLKQPGSSRKNLLIGAAALLIVSVLAVIFWSPLGNRPQSDATGFPPRGTPDQGRQSQAGRPPGTDNFPDEPPDRPGTGERRPGGKQFPGPRGPKAGNPPFNQASPRSQSIPLPLPPLSRKQFDKLLQNGPVDKMMADADAYAAANKENYVEIIDRYHVVQGRAAGTALEQEAERKINNAVDAHREALDEAIGKLEARMRELLRAGKAREAYNVWKEFPLQLRTPETDRQVRQILERSLPSNFQLEE